ncbi:DUF6380 family protein [Streptomyces sp. NPDC001595]
MQTVDPGDDTVEKRHATLRRTAASLTAAARPGRFPRRGRRSGEGAR